MGDEIDGHKVRFLAWDRVWFTKDGSRCQLAMGEKPKARSGRNEPGRRAKKFRPIVDGNVVVVGGRDKMVHALDPKTGEALWTFAAGARVDSSPVLVGDRVFFGSEKGVVHALDVVTGEETWRFETGSAVVASPAVADGRLVIGADNGVLYCFGEGG